MISTSGKPDFDIAVVGAGLAGLAAALTAHEAGARVVILEAADRIGGRIHAVFDRDGRPIADLGPTWVWPPYQPVVARWLKALELTTFDQFNTGNSVIEGYGPQLQRQHLPGQHGMVRISGGPYALIEAIVDKLPEGTIRLGSRVTEITEINEIKTNGLRLALAGKRDGMRTGQVILAVPPRLVGDTIIMPSIPQAFLGSLQNIPTWMATQTKVVILYQRAFWKAADLSGRVASRLGPLGEVHDHCAQDGRAALFGFLDGSANTLDRDGLRAGVLEQMVRCFGQKASAPDAIIVQDWSSEPFICSRRDRSTPSVHPDVGPAVLRQSHLGGRLWLAASETSDLSPGLIEGALHAGEVAARSATNSSGLPG